jgi:hypothetical protein
MDTNTPIASWVVQLGQRRIPNDMNTLLAGRRTVALVKIHHLRKSSPAEPWLREHMELTRHEVLLYPNRVYIDSPTEILYFILK